SSILLTICWFWSCSVATMSNYAMRSIGNSSSKGISKSEIAGVSFAVGAVLIFLVFMCNLCRGHRNGRDNAAAAERDAAAAGRAPQPAPAAQYWDDEEEEEEARSRTRRSPTAGLPSFTYNMSVKHNVTTSGGEDAAATCSVCLGAFQVGETVRLLPVCLHLYHVECIDPWLNAHSTCPICRSGIDPTMDDNLLPPHAAAVAAIVVRPSAPPEPDPWVWGGDDDQQLRDALDARRPRRGSRTADLPSFAYNRSVAHNVTGSAGDEAASTCSVCLGAFQVGETVRLLPVCLHLYHVECVDPWLDAHSTCPICRSGIDPPMDGGLLPPV
ncbi:hypothetical protein EJB05_41136, partial [Eragrostis curvula]